MHIPKLFLTFVLLLSLSVSVMGQEVSEDTWMPYFFEDDARQPVVDTMLFFVPVGDDSPLFDELTRYGMSFVSYRPKALDNRFNRILLDNVELSGGISDYYDFGLSGALTALAPDCSRVRYDDMAGAFSPLQSSLCSASASLADRKHSAVVTFSQKHYRTGLRLKSAAPLPKGWYYALSARLRAGDDAFVAGYFSNTMAASLALEKVFPDSARLKFFFLAAQNDYSSRGWVEPQVFRLTADNYYNPNWGFLGSSIRSARINSEFIPLGMCSVELPARNDNTCTLSVAGRFGYKSASALQWFGAANPNPDYYYNLPSHSADPMRAGDLETAWRSGDASFTQIDWNRLYEANIISDSGPAKYVLSDKNRRYRDFLAALSLEHTGSDLWRYGCGVRLRSQTTSFFRTLDDLLGGLYIMNVDPFTGAYCDTQHPFKPVMQGDRYDYDYDMKLRSASVYGESVLTGSRFRVVAGAELSFESYYRSGRFMRQGFGNGNASYGSSGVLSFTPFQIHADLGYSFSVRHRLNAVMFFAEYTPHFENMFLLPDYANATLTDVTAIRAAGLRVEYRLPLAYCADLEVSGCWTGFAHETQIIRYYDDIYAAYSVMAMENISKTDWNVEAALHVAVTDRLGVSAAFSTGAYLYADDPEISIFDGNTLKPVMTGDAAHLKGYVHTTTPQTLLVIKADYGTRNNWNFTADWSWAGRRYAALNPLRRTERVANATASPEELLRCIRQERLPDAAVFNVGISKGFSLRGVRVFVAAHVYNLLNRRDIIYGAYEQMRFDKISYRNTVSYSPFPMRCSYAYPRTFIVSLSVGF